MKALGLDDASKRLPREEAAARAAEVSGDPELQPPLAVSGGVTVLRHAPRPCLLLCWRVSGG